MIPAGRLRERITLESATETQDAAGQPIRTWSTLESGIPAEVVAVSGGEVIRGRQVHADAKYMITVRYRTDVTTLERVSWNSLTLPIVAVGDPYGDRRDLRIECSKE
jgi:SPP1 family predicted phage head-tail adaptor